VRELRQYDASHERLRFAGRAEDNVGGIFDGFHRFQGEFGNGQLIGALEFFEKTHSAQMPAIDLRQGQCTAIIAKHGTYFFYHICFSNPMVWSRFIGHNICSKWTIGYCIKRSLKLV
jgi:hypothetical protein